LRNKRQPILAYIIIGLAVIGLLSWLVKEPSRLLMTLLTTALIAALIFFIARALLRGETFTSSGQNEEMRKYKKAVKQSRERYGSPSKHQNKLSSSRPTIKRKSRKRPVHLTVIQGKKTLNKDDNDRASN